MFKNLPFKTVFIYTAAIISVISVLIYSVSIDGPFVFDDYQDIKQNPDIRLDSLSINKFYQAAFDSPSTARPVANLSFALNYYLDGLNVRGFHWFNIIIHFINGLLVFILAALTLQLFEMNKDKSPGNATNNAIYLCALLAALIFVCHPVQTQTVSFIVQRMTSLAAMFSFLALIFYIQGRTSGNTKHSSIYFVAGLFTWLLALGSKQNAAMLPVIIILYEWYFFQDLDNDWLKKNIKYFIGIFILITVISVIYLGGHPWDRIMADYEYRSFSMGERVLTQFRVITFYLSLLFFPTPSRLNLLHEFSVSQSLFTPITTLFSFIFLTGLLVYAAVFARRHRVISFCILWFFINLVIESSIIGLELIYEHRLYLPMFAFAFGTSYLLFRLLSNKPSILAVLAILTVVLLSTGSYIRNRVWTDPVILWSDVISKNPDSYRGHYNYANTLAKLGRVSEAVLHFQKALNIKPDISAGYRVQARKYLMHGNALLRERDFDGAKDSYFIAQHLDPLFAEPYNNLGNVLAQQGKIDEASALYARALELNPGYDAAHVNIGNLYVIKNDLDNACRHYQKALQLNPGLNEVKDYFFNHCRQK